MNVRRALSFVAALAALACNATGAVAAPAEQVVSGARIGAIAEPVARGLVHGDDKRVDAAFTIQDQAVPVGAATVRASGAPYVSATYVGIPVSIVVDGKVARTVVAGYRVTTFVQTAVAAHDLAPGALLGEGDVTLARIAANGRPTVGVAMLTGRKVRAATAKGAPLYLEQTAPDELVKAGQPAILIVHDGPVALAADVVARTGGALGDLVTVFNPQTGKALSATVTAAHRVELSLPSTGASL